MNSLKSTYEELRFKHLIDECGEPAGSNYNNAGGNFRANQDFRCPTYCWGSKISYIYAHSVCILESSTIDLIGKEVAGEVPSLTPLIVDLDPSLKEELVFLLEEKSATRLAKMEERLCLF